MTPLRRLIYVSKPAPALEGSDVASILEVARARNRASHITGFLAFNHETFLQVLEGSGEAVSECFGRIMADPRHTHVQLVSFEPIDAKGFPDWGMGYAAMHSRHAAHLARYCAGGRLTAEAMTPRGALMLLEELSAEVLMTSPPPGSVRPELFSASSTRLPVA
jgi:hypothetical protein